MALSMPGYESGDYDLVGQYLDEGINQVAKAGADFFICPDNTAHLILENRIAQQPIPGLHIAQVVCKEIVANGWKKVGLLGTKWTMTGSVYENALHQNGLVKMIPNAETRAQLNHAIFEELCQSVFRPETVQLFIDAIKALKNEGAECVILGCTEIPLIVTPENSPLPVLDSTRLLARYAVEIAIQSETLPQKGWINLK